MHDVDDVRLHLSRVLPRLLRHLVVPVIQLVGAGESLLGTTHPTDRDPVELVVFYLVRLDVAVGDGAFGGEDVGIVSPGFQFPRQSKRHDLDAGAMVGEKLVDSEKYLHRRKSQSLTLVERRSRRSVTPPASISLIIRGLDPLAQESVQL